MHTGFYDRDGIPIHVGDLIRVQHYRHRRRGRMMWLHFRVAINPTSKNEADHGRFVVQNWSDLQPDSFQCLLPDVGLRWAEVIDHAGLEHDEHGNLITFNERKRKRGAS